MRRRKDAKEPVPLSLRTSVSHPQSGVHWRIALKSILKIATKGDAVIIYKYDRLGRSLIEALQNLETLENERKATVYSATEENSEVVRNLLLTMAQEYSRQLSARCKGALDGIAESGHVANGAPYGYDIVQSGNRKKFEPSKTEAPVVKRVFEMRAAGKSHRQIIRTLNEEKIPSPRKGL
jgi:DNA invertase Pin-like site-specific DNA recombinase